MASMKLYRVFNGYVGNSSIHCIVVAADAAEARREASRRFRARAIERAGSINDGYDESYWTDLHAVCLTDDLTEVWAGGPYD